MKRTQRQLIYLDCRQYRVSGIGTYIENLLDQFDRNPSELDFHLLVRKQHKENLSSKRNFQLSEYNEAIYSFKEQVNWVTKIAPLGILHVPHYNAPLLYPGKLIITVHDVCHLAMRRYFPGLLKRMYSSLFFKRILLKADHIITVSNFSKSEIIKYFNVNPQKISVIYNGVSPQYRPVSHHESDPILKEYNLPREYILFLGNIKPHKNVQGVLSSYLKAAKKEKELPPLVILGNNTKMYEEIPHIREYLNHEIIKQKVIFTGYLPNTALPALYSRALLFLFPSFYEGFGLTVLEAMACGTPVITSNCSAIPEVVNGSALLIDPHDDDEIARQIVNLAMDNELQNDLISKGFAISKRYSWTKAAREHLKIYNQISDQSAAIKSPPADTPLKQVKKNILFMDQFGDRIGGGQIILLDILERFRASENWQIYISVPEEGKFTKLLAEHGFSTEIVQVWQPVWHNDVTVSDMIKYVLSSIRSSYFIGKIIKKYEIDVVYCNGGRTFLNGTFLSLLFSLKLFFHLHLLLEEKQKRAVTILGRFPGVKSIFAVSNLLEQQYVKHSVHKKMCVVSNWVSPGLLNKKRQYRKDLLAKPLRLGIVGQISKVKGQWAVLNSFSESETVLPISLSLFGEPLKSDIEHWQQMQETIKQLTAKGWDIQYKGFVSDKLEIYDNIDILLIPSFVPESFGLTAIEAMAREVVVVANRSGALVEIIENRVNGILYQAGKAQELMTILNDLIENKIDVNELRKGGLYTVEKKYHPQKQLNLLHRTVFEAVK